MTMRLRGLRYQPAPDGPNAWLTRLIVEELPFVGVEKANAFYDVVLTRPEITLNDIAFLGCNDRYFLLTRLCGRKKDMYEDLTLDQASWLYDRCREVEAEPDGFLDLWARYHYKSTIITFAGTIQDILDDPEITICIFSAVKPIAHEFLAQIKEEFEGNDLLKSVYADVLWADPRKKDAVDGRPPKWGIARGIVVKRKSNPKEATIEAHGLLDGQPTSRHYMKHVYDDVVHQDYLSEDQIKKTTERYELADNLGSHKGVRKQIAGTRYHWADTYGVILEEDRGGLKPRIYPATDDGTLNGKPVFLSDAKWADVKSTQRSTVSAQMLLNPVAGQEQIFNVAWYRPYFVRPRTLNVYILCDPSKGKTKKNDRTAIAVIGIDVLGNKYLLDGYCHRMTLSQRWTCIRGLWLKWSDMPGVQMVKVGYEVYGMQTDIEHFNEKMLEDPDKIRFDLHELNWVREGSQSKNDRIERLEPDLRGSKFYLPGLVYHATRGGEDKIASWKYDPATKVATYTPFVQQTKSMDLVDEQGEPYRKAIALRRVERIGQDNDQQTTIYDVTRALMEELRLFPFAPFDDMSDVCSRIYDIEANTPMLVDDSELDPTEFPD